MSTITSTTSGDWSVGSTWVGGVSPGTGDKAIIDTGDTVTVTADVDVGDGTTAAVQVDGTLKFHRTNDINFDVTGRIQVNDTGELDVGKSGDECTGDIVFGLNKGGGSGNNFGIFFQDSFKLYMAGTSKTTNTVSTAAAASSATTIQVNEATNWAANDELVIVRQDAFSTPHYTTISSVTANGSNFDVVINDAMPWAINPDAPVGNLTKNIEMKPFSGTGTGTGFRTLSVDDDAVIDLSNVRFSNLDAGGPNDGLLFNQSATNGDVIDRFTDVVVYGDGSTRGINFNGFRQNSSDIKNLAIALKGNRDGISIRSSAGVNFRDSVIYDSGSSVVTNFSAGATGASLDNMKFCGRRAGASVVNAQNCIQISITNSLFVGSTGGNCIRSNDCGLINLGNNKYGIDDANWSLSYNRIIESAGTGLTIAILDSGGSTRNTTDIVDYGSTINNYDINSLNSVIYFEGLDSGVNRLLYPTGAVIPQSTTAETNGQALEVTHTSNTNDFELPWNVTVPPSVDIIVAMNVRRVSGFTAGTSPTITVTTPSGESEADVMSATDDAWEMVSITLNQTSGADEVATVKFSAGADSGDKSFMDLIGLGSYGYGRIRLIEPDVSNNTQLIVGQLAEVGVTETSATALAHTGITITDHGGTPVTWNSLSWGITIEGDLSTNPSLTADNIKHYLEYYLSQPSTFQGKPSGYHWHDMIPFAGTVTQRGDYGGGTFKGVRVVDENGDAFIGITQMESDDGTTYANGRVFVTGPNLIDGTRVQIYNVTQDVELDNSLVSGGSGYSTIVDIEGADVSDGDTIRLRATFQSGVSAKQPIETEGVINTNGLVFVNSQSEQSTYVSFGVDGSSVSEFSWDSGNIEVDINDADNTTTIQRIAAWYFYFITTSTGIDEAFGAVTWDSLNTVQLNSSVVGMTFDNTKTTPLLITGGRIFRSDGATIIASGSESIQIDAELSNKPLTAAQESQLDSIDRNTKLIPATL